MADGLAEAQPEGEFTLPGDVDRGETTPDPGLAVGFSGEDLDDVSPPVLHDGALPVGYEFDSLLPHLGFLARSCRRHGACPFLRRPALLHHGSTGKITQHSDANQ